MGFNIPPVPYPSSTIYRRKRRKILQLQALSPDSFKKNDAAIEIYPTNSANFLDAWMGKFKGGNPKSKRREGETRW